MSASGAKKARAQPTAWVSRLRFHLPLAIGIVIYVALCLGPLVSTLTTLGARPEPASVVQAEPTGPLVQPTGSSVLRRRLRLLWSGVKTALAATAFCALVGIPCALIICKTNVPGKSAWPWIWSMLLLLPSYFHALAWLGLLGWSGQRGVLEAAAAVSSNMLGAALLLAVAYVPVTTLVAWMAFKTTDPVQETASLLHFGPLGGLRTAFRLAAPGLGLALLLTFLLALADFGVPSFMGVQVLQVEVFSKVSGEYDFRGAGAAAMPLVCVSLAGGLAVGTGLWRSLKSPRLGRRRNAVRYSLNRPLRLCAVGVVLCACGVCSLPIWVCARNAGPWREFLSAVRMAAPSLRSSLITACVSATVSAAIGLYLAYSAPSGRWAAVMGLLACATIVVPGMLVGLGLARILGNPLLRAAADSPLGLGIGSAARYAPLAVCLALLARQAAGEDAFQAIGLSGMGFVRGLRCVALRILAPALALGWLLCYGLSLGEVDVALMVSPPGMSTLPMRTYSLYHYGQDQIVATFVLLQTGCLLLPFVLFLCFKAAVRSRRAQFRRGYHSMSTPVNLISLASMIFSLLFSIFSTLP